MSDREPQRIAKGDVGKVPKEIVEDDGKLPATTGNGGVPVVADPTDFGAEAGAGFEGTRLEEQTVPFLRMAQGLSPELNNPGKGEHIPRVGAGDDIQYGDPRALRRQRAYPVHRVS